MKKEILHAYLAGLIDGEGTVTITKEKANSKFKMPVVSVASTTIELLNILVDNYGGAISNKKLYKEHHKPSFNWRLTNQKALLLLNDILPYMLEPVKVYRAKLLIDSYDKLTNRNGKYTETQIKDKLEFEHLFFHPSSSIGNIPLAAL